MTRIPSPVGGLGMMLIAVVVGACDNCSSPTEPVPAAPSGSIESAASASVQVKNSARPRAQFAFSFNGERARNVLVIQGVPRPLVSVATASAQDVSKWRDLVVTTNSGKPQTVEYRTQYADGHEARMYLNAEDRLCLGIFKSGGDEPVQELVDVNAIDLLVDMLPDGPPPVLFGTEKKTIDLSAWEKLRKIPKGSDGDKAGVRLQDVLRQLDGAATLGSVTIKGSESRTFCASELDGTDQEVLLRENKRGELFIDVWLPADKLKPSTRIRRLEQLSVSAEPCKTTPPNAP